jgi:integrase
MMAPVTRRFITRRFWCVLGRHRLQRLCYEARLHTRAGRLPLVLWTRPTKVGERSHVLCRAGICAEDFEAHRPIEPRNLVRSFIRVCDQNGIRKIRVHALRHTAASLFKDLHVPARDAQIILGHAHISTTQQIYTYVDEAAPRLDALTRLDRLLGGQQ